jgi:hypothetical protein
VLPNRAAAPFFRHPMPWELRGLLSLVGGVLVLLGAACLAVVGLLVWAAFAA